MTSTYGTKEWFESQFDKTDSLGDKWGHQWRGSQKYRYLLYLRILKKLIPSQKTLKILDIGCALGDFTQKVSQLDTKNEIYGVDISENAIKMVSKKYPGMKFRINFLPDLSFDRNSFDLVMCLEVLYYLNREDRVTSLCNIKNILVSQGYFLFSAVLDGGVHYFSEEEVVQMISDNFYIEVINFNYAKLYTLLETKLILFINISRILTMDKTKFTHWCNEIQNENNREKIRNLINVRVLLCSPLLFRVTKSILLVSDKVISYFISKELPVILFYYLTKYILGDKGKTHIIILARKFD